MTPVPVPERVELGSWGDVLWLSDSMASSLAADYPALAEVVTALHALPYELNRQFAELPASSDSSAAKAPASADDATPVPPPSPKGFVEVPPLASVRLTVRFSPRLLITLLQYAFYRMWYLYCSTLVLVFKSVSCSIFRKFLFLRCTK